MSAGVDLDAPNTFLSLICALGLALTCAPARSAPAPRPGAGERPVFWAFVGQSNMVGQGMTLRTLSATGWKRDPRTFVWDNRDNRFEVMEPTVNTAVYSWGPEIGAILAFRAAHPSTPLYIAKTAAGETGLAQNLNANDDWSPASRGEMFDKAQARIDAASKVVGRRPDAVFIDQGETDGTDRAAAAAYAANFAALVSAARARLLHDPRGLVIWARVPASTRYGRQVSAAQLKVDEATAATASFATDDPALYPRQPDGIHYDARGLMQVGRRYYRLWEEMRGRP